VPKKVEQINDHLFIDTYKSNNIKIGVNDMTVNDSEMCEMKRRTLVNTGDISPEIAQVNTDYKKERKIWVFNFLRKREAGRFLLFRLSSFHLFIMFQMLFLIVSSSLTRFVLFRIHALLQSLIADGLQHIILSESFNYTLLHTTTFKSFELPQSDFVVV